jgi:hypothetical protein
MTVGIHRQKNEIDKGRTVCKFCDGMKNQSRASVELGR